MHWSPSPREPRGLVLGPMVGAAPVGASRPDRGSLFHELMTGSGTFLGVVHETGGGIYAVVLETGERVDASLRGSLKKKDRTGRVVVLEVVKVWS